MRRLLAIGFTWLCCAVAWAILGSTLTVRSGGAFDGLRGQVHGLWGPPLVQAPPFALGTEKHRERKIEQRFDEKRQRYVAVEKEEEVTSEYALPLDGSDLHASLSLEHRRKGLLWFPTYSVAFSGRYVFRNGSAQARDVTVRFPVEPGVTYDGFSVRGADGKPIEVQFESGQARFARRLGPGEVET